MLKRAQKQHWDAVLWKKRRLRQGGTGDTTAPSVTITLSQYTFKSGDTATVTFTFSEAPTGFTVVDVTAPNGSLSSFGATGDPLVYTATFTPTAGVTDAANVITAGTGWTDAAGNPPAGATTSDNYTVDTAAPTVTITCAQSSPSATTPLNFTFTFSEDVTGFAIGDITVGNGSAGNFAGSGAVYTCDVTPTAAGTVTVDVGAGVCTDLAGNANTAATQLSILYVPAFSDTFTAADTTTLSGRSSNSGHVWTVHTGTFRIMSNHLEPNSHADGDIATVEYAWYNFLYEGYLTPFSSAANTKSMPGLVFRYQDASNFWLVQVDSGNDVITLYKRIAGTYTAVSNPAYVFNSGTAYKISILTSGSNINVFVNDVEVIAVTGQTQLQTATRIGVRIGKNGSPADTCEWDTLTA